jgi:hypothetical protein
MTDWRGVPIAPSRLQALLHDDPRVRAYGRRAGRGLARSFEQYLQAKLLPLNGWREVGAFLTACLYAKDDAVHERRDVWMHPEDFERRRAGDCEDHALWAWVQLARLGWDVRFTAGLHRGGGHAWLTAFRGKQVRLVEATAKASGELLLEAADGAGYEPVWSVDPQLRFFVHAAP